MTIIAYKDGILAVDSLVSDGDVLVGEMQKWRRVKSAGRGIVAGAGSMTDVQRALDLVDEGGCLEIREGSTSLLWAHADGVVEYIDQNGRAVATDAFFAEGNGRNVAIGAMAAGASARRAVEIVCERVSGCGGKIYAFDVATGNEVTA